MAIKVRHDGNAAATAAAGLGSGTAKSRIETAKLAQNTPQHIQTLTPAHTSAPGAGGGSAPLTHAPSGASGGNAPLIQGHGGGGGRSRLSPGGAGGVGGASGLGGDDYKVTGTSIFDRPDDESQWDPGNGGRWIRKWLPGEKEAEVQQRVGDVKNAQQMELIDVQHRNAMERSEQNSLLGIDADVKKAMLNLPPAVGQLPEPAIRSPFATDTSGGETPEVFNKLKKISPELVGMRDSMNDGGLLKPFDTAMTMVLNTIYGNDVIPPQDGKPGSRNLGAIFDSLYQGGSQPVAPAAQDDLSGVYDAGGSIFGAQDGGGTDRSMSWLHATDPESAPVGGESVASNEYATSIGGLIGMFLRKKYV